MKGKIIKGIAGFYYVHVADAWPYNGHGVRMQGKRSLSQGSQKTPGRG